MKQRWRIYFSASEDLEYVKQMTFRIVQARGFTAASLFGGLGLWDRTIEPAYLLEIIVQVNNDLAIRALASDIKAQFKQDAVLVTCEVVVGELL